MKKSLPSSVLNKPEKVSDPFSSLIIAHFLWMCSIFLKFCLYFSTKFPAKNYAKKRFLFFFVIFGNSVNFGIVLTMIFLMKSNNVHKAYFSCGKTTCSSAFFVKRKQAYNQSICLFWYYLFLNLSSKPEKTLGRSSSGPLSDMNSIYLPVPMATQLTASSATMAWMPVLLWISLSRP